MRTIKFRGQVMFPENGIVLNCDKKEGEWVYGDLHLQSRVPHIHMFGKQYPINPATVGQFTGLLDKNGKEIYEGDIIGCHNPDIKHLIFYNEKQGRFMAALNGDIENYFVGVCGLDDSRWNASKEVIGNIHDNPELLKGGNK